jgi:transposase
VDEAGIDNTIDYPYGYCHKSERFHATKLGHRTERLSMISGWRDGEIIAPMLFKGYCNTGLVCKWREEFLVPELLPGQILVIDNASFHPQERIKQLIAQAGCEVIFLPPYSPDLNKIEKFWARLKLHVSKIIGQCESLWDAVQQAFCQLS